VKDIKNFLINWFELNSDISTKELEENLGANYFEEGWLDSFRFITLITDLEEKFAIEFNHDEFQNRNFSTIEGLIRIISEKLK
jgi:acyl carrier protein